MAETPVGLANPNVFAHPHTYWPGPRHVGLSASVEPPRATAVMSLPLRPLSGHGANEAPTAVLRDGCLLAR